MLSLLIVDDEMLIADSLYAMVSEAFQERLAVRRCYSALEAQRLMERTPINILMTDINMPNVSGLELHRWVNHRWPMTRVIYLTGYSDFEYVREALTQHAQSYVLKSDGDEKIVGAIEAAIQDIDRDSERLLAEANTAQARPLFVQQLAQRLIYGGAGDMDALRADLERWGLGLDADRPLLVGYCYLDKPSALDTAIAMLDMVSQGYAALLAAEINPLSILVLAQTPSPDDTDALAGLMEEVQRILEGHGHYLTVALLDAPVPWDRLPEANAQLLMRLHEVTPGTGETLRLRFDEAQAVSPAPIGGEEWAETLGIIRNMYDYLVIGNRSLYFSEERKLWELLNQQDSRMHALVFQSVGLNLQMAVQGLSLDERVVRRLHHLEVTWQNVAPGFACAQLHELAELLFAAKGLKANWRMQDLTRQINGYIQNHLGEELSLTALADMVHFHPVYLSRVYKETTGTSLSDFIADCRMNAACTMLRDTRDTVAEISRATGFSSANYFARWFRKRAGMSPQEYRDAHAPQA